MGSRPGEEVASKIVLNSELDLAALAVEPAAELCGGFWQQYEAIMKTGQSGIFCFLNGLSEPLVEFLKL